MNRQSLESKSIKKEDALKLRKRKCINFLNNEKVGLPGFAAKYDNGFQLAGCMVGDQLVGTGQRRGVCEGPI